MNYDDIAARLIEIHRTRTPGDGCRRIEVECRRDGEFELADFMRQMGDALYLNATNSTRPCQVLSCQVPVRTLDRRSVHGTQ